MKRIVVIICTLCISLLLQLPVFAVDCTSSDPCKGKSVEESVTCYQQVVDSCQNTKNTLSSQISYLNNQIQLTTFQIQSVKGFIANLTAEINQLAGEVEILETKLTKQTELLQKRVPESYKEYVKSSDFTSLMFSKDIGDLVARIQYIKKVQQQDLKLFVQYKATQNNYAERKTQREEKKQKQVEAEKELEYKNKQLAQQKQDKDMLLAQTKGQESIFQNLLAAARAEYQQIQGIIAGGGSEVKVGEVKKGDKIASVISGSSCNSTGTHLHFTVSKNGITENPFNYLKSVDHVNDSGGDAFNPSGSWDWPIAPQIQLNQGYGNTWYVRMYRPYPTHNGIDIDGSSLDVKAVQDGTVYRGFYSGNCRLQYVRLEHKDGGIMTYYLHVNYN
ncbi:MAG: hypothetical protein WAV51_03160 [Microgenomates group bacterium]